MSEMQHERIKTLCDSLHFLAVPKVYVNLADVAAQEKSSFVDYLEAVLRSEHDLRQGRSRQTMARLAGFPSIKTLDRLLHHANVVQIRGDSYRLKDKCKSRIIGQQIPVIQTEE
jgi:DNA replication protein DnaC